MIAATFIGNSFCMKIYTALCGCTPFNNGFYVLFYMIFREISTGEWFFPGFIDTVR